MQQKLCVAQQNQKESYEREKAGRDYPKEGTEHL